MVFQQEHDCKAFGAGIDNDHYNFALPNWGAPRPLSGNQLLSGTAIPNSELGRPGDFYYRTTTQELYGPRTDNNDEVVVSFPVERVPTPNTGYSIAVNFTPRGTTNTIQLFNANWISGTTN